PVSPTLSPASRRQLIQQLAGSIGQLETAGQLARRLQVAPPAGLPSGLSDGFPDGLPSSPPTSSDRSATLAPGTLFPAKLLPGALFPDLLAPAPLTSLPAAVSGLSPAAERDSGPQHKPGLAPACPVSAKSIPPTAPPTDSLPESPFALLLGPAGWPRGGLLEIQSLGWGAGGLTLVLAILRELIPTPAPPGELSRRRPGPLSSPRQASRRAKPRAAGNWGLATRNNSLAPAAHSPAGVVLIDTEHQLYAPALVAWGLSPEHTVVVRPRNPADALWACEQALRNRGVAAVWCHNTRWNSRHLRRLHLAARTGQSLGLITSFPEQHAAPGPSAQRRWRITPLLSPPLLSQPRNAAAYDRWEPSGATADRGGETRASPRERVAGPRPERDQEWTLERGEGCFSVARRWRLEQ
ncbi:MAG: hypothetical protein ACKOGA_11160, partial [Planctomycetaceae bacterium]